MAVITLNQAVGRTLLAMTRERQGVLPFLGAGFSAWPNVAVPTDMNAFLAELPEVVVSGDRAVRAVTNHWRTFCGGIVDPVDKAEGAAPSWFLQACLFALLSPQQREKLPADRSDVDLAILSQLVYDENPGAMKDVLKRLYGTEARHKPNSRHRKLSYFPLDVIVTTNYDRCMEEALKEVGKPPVVIANDGNLKGRGLRCPVILKIHGMLDDFAPVIDVTKTAWDYVNKIVLTDAHYWDFPNGRDLMTDHLRTLLASRQVIFLGYGFRDFNIIEQFHKLSRHKHDLPRAILLLRESPELLVERLGKRGIDVCEENLDTFLEEMNLSSFGVKDLDKLEGVDDRKGAARQTCAAVGAIMRTTSGNGKFKESLREALIWPSFSDTKLRLYCEWENRSPGFESVGWLRRLDRGNGDISWEFPGDIRFGLCLALEVLQQDILENP